jgi:hypothetical protein
MKKLLFIVLLCVLPYYLKAEVFSLMPFSGSSASETPGHFIASVLEGIELAPESVKINGADLKLNMRLISVPLENCAEIIVKSFKGVNFYVSENTLMADFRHSDGALERIYLVSFSEGVFPVIQFSILFPDGLPANHGEWCEGLPLPTGSAVGTSMYFPERDLKYGSFTSYRSRQAVEEELSLMLENSEWKRLTDGIFINSDTKKMIVFSVSEPDSSNKVSGFIIEKPFNPEK